MSNRRLILIPLLLLGLFRSIDLFVPYYNHDEVTNALFANFILDGRMGLLDFLGNTYILTHYIYVLVAFLFGKNQIWAVHAFHFVWCAGTVGALYLAGRELTRSKTGGMFAALFYVVVSVSFMSKDFRAALAESFSLLPSGVAVYFYFRGAASRRGGLFLMAGIFAGLAGLAKAPAIVVLFAMLVSILFVEDDSRLKHSFFLLLGSFIAVSLPFLMAGDPIEAFSRVQSKLEETRSFYITVYDNLGPLYWIPKYAVRTLLVAVCSFLVWFFAYQTIRDNLILSSKKERILKSRVFFLICWFMASWLAISLGKRIFYHYFVFLVPIVSLLAAPAACTLWKEMGENLKTKKARILALCLMIPPLGFTVEAAAGWSVLRKDFSAISDHVRRTTAPGDLIYVWGLVPQIYFDSGRDPATTFFWSDTLAGISPGSAAMEYMNASGVQLKPSDSVKRDFMPFSENETNPDDVTNNKMDRLGERDLLTDQELLESIPNPFWRHVFKDFARRPPVLFIDSSPSDIRGFSRFPLEKYELLKRFVKQNYVFEKVIDQMVVYRLKGEPDVD